MDLLSFADHLLKNLHKCIALNTIYQEEYRKAKETLGQNPLGKQFDFNELHIFGKFELFCKRIQKLIDVFTTIEQFMSLSQVTCCIIDFGLALPPLL